MLVSASGVTDYPLTWLLPLLCLGCFLAVAQGVLPSSSLLFFESFNVHSAAQQPWRFFTPVLLHHTWLHVLTNLVVWAEFARQVEKNQGSVVLLLLTLALAIPSHVLEFVMVDNQFGGLSGVVLGLGAYIGTRRLFESSDTWYFPAVYWLALLAMFILDAAGLQGEKSAVYVHGGGLFLGACFGLAAGLYVRYRYQDASRG